GGSYRAGRRQQVSRPRASPYLRARRNRRADHRHHPARAHAPRGQGCGAALAAGRAGSGRTGQKPCEGDPPMTGFATDREIAQQPAIWREWGRQLPQVATRIRDWLAASPADEIWLCGAGTSAFIGDSHAVALDATSGRRVRSVATTDLVARPADHVQPGRRPLVVSFGRSGNSSESVGTLDILDRMLPAADRLNITCNAEGVLARRPPQGPGRQEVIVLPAACHDAGFAMTSSYSTMYLTALACLGGAEAGSIAARMAALADGATALLAAPLALPRPRRVRLRRAAP